MKSPNRSAKSRNSAARLESVSADFFAGSPTQPADETLDTLFSGKLKLFQSRDGYRFSLDALLLANFVTVKPRERVIDLGTGSGVIPLILARLHENVALAGVEIQPAMVERAARNIRLNRLAAQIQIYAGDVRAMDRTTPAASFDVAVCNPPYRLAGSGRNSPNDEKRIARHEGCATLDDFLTGARFVLRGKGRVAVVYLADRAVELFSAMSAARLEPKRVRMVHSFVSAEASLVLVEGVKDGRRGVKILPPLIVYREGKAYSDEVAAIIGGK